MAAIDLLFDTKLSSERLHQLALGAILTRTRVLERLGIPGEPESEFGWEAEGRLFDLSVPFRRDAPTGTVWVEIKVDSSAYLDQAKRQIDFINRPGRDRDRLLYLVLGTTSFTWGAAGTLRQIERTERCHVATADKLVDILTHFDEHLIRNDKDRDARDLANAYRDALVRLQNRTKRIEADGLKPSDWDYMDRVGFLQACRRFEQMEGAGIDYVANQSRDFVGAWWGWKTIGPNREEIYLQWELPEDATQAILVAKVVVPEESRRSYVRETMSHRVLSISAELGIRASRPARFGHGETMTVAILGTPFKENVLDWVQVERLVDDAQRVLDAVAAAGELPGQLPTMPGQTA